MILQVVAVVVVDSIMSKTFWRLPGRRGYRKVPTLMDSATSGFLALEEEAFLSGAASQLGPLQWKI